MKIKSLIITIFISFSLHLAAQESLESTFEKSYALEKQGNYTAAIAVMKAVYSASDYEVNLRLGYLHYEAALYTASMGYYLHSIALNPGAIEPRMGYVYPASMLGKWDDVLKQYVEILVLDPRNSSVNYKTGLIYYNRKNYKFAYSYFGNIIILYPFDYDALLMYAWCNLQLGKSKEARIYFNKVLLLSPKDKSALEGLSLLK